MVRSKHLSPIIFVIILLAVLIAPALYLSKHAQEIPVNLSLQKQLKVEKNPETPQYYDRAGEEIEYSINMGNFTLGTAIFKCLPNIQENGRVLAVMTLNTRLKTFRDEETIFTDALTLMPVRVYRDIKNLLKHDKINEQYDSENFTITVIKNAGQKEENRTVFKRDSPIHNPILLPHYVRRMSELKIGQIINANLAKRSYEIKLVGMQTIKTKAGIFKTFHFESNPKQIEIWLSDDKDRIPVKIQGLGMFSYALEMNKYTPPIKSKSKSQ